MKFPGHAVRRVPEHGGLVPAAGVQVITASRFDVGASCPASPGVLVHPAAAPDPERIRAHFGRAGVAPPPEADPLWTVIDYPLMLVLYARTQLLQARPSAIPWPGGGGQRRRRPVELPSRSCGAAKARLEPGKPGPNRPGHGMPGPPPGLEHGPPGGSSASRRRRFTELENALAELPASGQKDLAGPCAMRPAPHRGAAYPPTGGRLVLFTHPTAEPVPHPGTAPKVPWSA